MSTSANSTAREYSPSPSGQTSNIEHPLESDVMINMPPSKPYRTVQAPLKNGQGMKKVNALLYKSRKAFNKTDAPTHKASGLATPTEVTIDPKQVKLKVGTASATTLRTADEKILAGHATEYDPRRMRLLKEETEGIHVSHKVASNIREGVDDIGNPAKFTIIKLRPGHSWLQQPIRVTKYTLTKAQNIVDAPWSYPNVKFYMEDRVAEVQHMEPGEYTAVVIRAKNAEKAAKAAAKKLASEQSKINKKKRTTAATAKKTKKTSPKETQVKEPRGKKRAAPTPIQDVIWASDSEHNSDSNNGPPAAKKAKKVALTEKTAPQSLARVGVVPDDEHGEVPVPTKKVPTPKGQKTHKSAEYVAASDYESLDDMIDEDTLNGIKKVVGAATKKNANRQAGRIGKKGVAQRKVPAKRTKNVTVVEEGDDEV
ncbi:hypothetical protein BDV96DRAFT_655903 [Lophiotrema nucula]|uniref:Uncharacterized protein n=1 Tax=Lophiotrema nucula TaxID=690887 RepID=A0A6A5YEM7_9PLEO|nr:hypothetical protein BDV96DRAFT_655903 [Lophiotrema nucula]